MFPRCHQFIGNNQDQVSLWRDFYLGGGQSVEAARLRRLEEVDVVEGGEVVMMCDGGYVGRDEECYVER